MSGLGAVALAARSPARAAARPPPSRRAPAGVSKRSRCTPGAAGRPQPPRATRRGWAAPSPVSTAAAVARAAYPGLTADTRPQAVAIADVERLARGAGRLRRWRARRWARRCCTPKATACRGPANWRLRAMHPTGAGALGGAQVILLGPSIEAPAGYRARGTARRERLRAGRLGRKAARHRARRRVPVR